MFVLQLATIVELLEGLLYGMDLLKLQSVTTRLQARVDHMEKVNSLSLQAPKEVTPTLFTSIHLDSRLKMSHSRQHKLDS